jgi:hypothetical protein
MTRDEIEGRAREIVEAHVLGYPGEGLVPAIAAALVEMWDAACEDVATELGRWWPEDREQIDRIARAKKLGGPR